MINQTMRPLHFIAMFICFSSFTQATEIEMVCQESDSFIKIIERLIDEENPKHPIFLNPDDFSEQRGELFYQAVKIDASPALINLLNFASDRNFWLKIDHRPHDWGWEVHIKAVIPTFSQKIFLPEDIRIHKTYDEDSLIISSRNTPDFQVEFERSSPSARSISEMIKGRFTAAWSNNKALQFNSDGQFNKVPILVDIPRHLQQLRTYVVINPHDIILTSSGWLFQTHTMELRLPVQAEACDELEKEPANKVVEEATVVDEIRPEGIRVTHGKWNLNERQKNYLEKELIPAAKSRDRDIVIELRALNRFANIYSYDIPDNFYMYLSSSSY